MTVEFDVVDLGPSEVVPPGEPAPPFTRPLVTDEGWTDRSLGALAADGPLLLVFTPMAGSFLATYTWSEIRDRGWDAYGTTVVGVSASTPYELAAFLRDGDHPFGIFADPANGVADAYGVVHDLDGMAGIAEPRLAAFLIDDGLVEESWVSREWPEFLPYDAIEAVIGD